MMHLVIATYPTRMMTTLAAASCHLKMEGVVATCYFSMCIAVARCEIAAGSSWLLMDAICLIFVTILWTAYLIDQLKGVAFNATGGGRVVARMLIHVRVRQHSRRTN